LRAGDTWKIYLNASCPGGKMINIFATIEQLGKEDPNPEKSKRGRTSGVN